MPSMTVTDLTGWMRCRASHQSGRAAVGPLGLTTTHGPLTLGPARETPDGDGYAVVCPPTQVRAYTHLSHLPGRACRGKIQVPNWLVATRQARLGGHSLVPTGKTNASRLLWVSRQLGLLRCLEPSSLKPRACRSIGWSTRLRWSKIRSAIIPAVCNKDLPTLSDS